MSPWGLKNYRGRFSIFSLNNKAIKKEIKKVSCPNYRTIFSLPHDHQYERSNRSYVKKHGKSKLILNYVWKLCTNVDVISAFPLQDEHQWLQSAETPGNAPAKAFKGLRYAATPRCCSEARTATCPQLPQHHPSLPHKNTHNHAPRGTRTSAGSDTPPPPPSLANAHTHRSIAGWSAQHVKWAWRTGVGLRQAHSRCSGANAVPTRRARLPLRHVHRMPCTHWRDGKKARRLLSKHLPQQTCSKSPSLAFSVGSVLIWTPWLLQYLCFIYF